MDGVPGPALPCGGVFGLGPFLCASAAMAFSPWAGASANAMWRYAPRPRGPALPWDAPPSLFDPLRVSEEVWMMARGLGPMPTDELEDEVVEHGGADVQQQPVHCQLVSVA